MKISAKTVFRRALVILSSSKIINFNAIDHFNQIRTWKKCGESVDCQPGGQVRFGQSVLYGEVRDKVNGEGLRDTKKPF